MNTTRQSLVANLIALHQVLFTLAFVSGTFSHTQGQEPVCRLPVDWTSLPSTFTHDSNGRRVDQYAMHVQPMASERADFQQSGFRHSRSTLQAGTSVDNYHLVERWGAPVQPYGEWRYPYRPFAVPYGAWGPQPPVVNSQFGFGLGDRTQVSPWHGQPGMGPAAGHGGFPPGGPGTGMGGFFPGGPNAGFGGFPGGPQWSNGFGVGPNNALRPDQDDYYAPAPEPPPISDREFFFSPLGK